MVLQCGISPDYVLDHMQVYEINALMDNIWMKDRENWMRTKFESYITAQMNSSKKLKPDDIITFPWEKKHHTHIDSAEEMKEMEEELKKMQNKLNNI